MTPTTGDTRATALTPRDGGTPGRHPGVGSPDGGSRTDRSGPRPVASVCILLIRGYQLARAGRVSLCRFTPSCSEYAAVAIGRHGVGRGLLLTIRRLGRCRPGGPFGSDPVPE